MRRSEEKENNDKVKGMKGVKTSDAGRKD